MGQAAPFFSIRTQSPTALTQKPFEQGKFEEPLG